jgi:hypothetical protein
MVAMTVIRASLARATEIPACVERGYTAQKLITREREANLVHIMDVDSGVVLVGHGVSDLFNAGVSTIYASNRAGIGFTWW